MTIGDTSDTDVSLQITNANSLSRPTGKRATDRRHRHVKRGECPSVVGRPARDRRDAYPTVTLRVPRPQSRGGEPSEVLCG